MRLPLDLDRQKSFMIVDTTGFHSVRQWADFLGAGFDDRLKPRP